MKKVVVLLMCMYIASTVQALSEEMQALVDNLHRECIKQSGATDDQVARANKGDFDEDENFKCYNKCIMTEIAVLDEDTGEVDVEGAAAMLPDDIAEEMGQAIRECGTQKGATLCETAWLTNKCYAAKKPKIFFLP